MTSKTSFFNKGIYLSTIKRFSWGSVLYFLLLFMFTVLSCLLYTEPIYGNGHSPAYESPLLFQDAFLAVPLLLSVVVPVITSALIFRFLHSKGYSVFVHSLPVSKKANYISSSAAGFFLMLAPVVFNTLLLMILSIGGYGAYFSVADCLMWLGINTFALFIIYSVAVFSSVITGNSFAVFIINILIHTILFVVVSAFEILAGRFVLGYPGDGNLLEILYENNFVTFVVSLSNQYFRVDVEPFKIILFLIVAVVFYIASYYIYKKRKNETATDVAGFKFLNSIFKYAITFIATIFSFAIFTVNTDRISPIIYVMIFINSAVIYFGLEMLLKKTLNVFYAYKGYIAFAAVFSVMMFILCGTSFFGYETRIPDISDIEYATAYDYYFQDEEPFFASPDMIKEIHSIHSDMIKTKEKGTDYLYSAYQRVHIKYVLKNQKTVTRSYRISDAYMETVMTKLYKHDEYKKGCETAFIDNDLIESIHLGEKYIDKKDEFLEVLRRDTLRLGYSDIRNRGTIEEDERYQIIITNAVKEDGVIRTHSYNSYIMLNKKYAETLKWLRDNEYLEDN